MRTLLRFGKTSRLRFVSHLDLQRFFQRALNRTGLPIAYSQGFNPVSYTHLDVYKRQR